MENFEDIYETMLGFRIPETCVPGVEDAFSEGSLCQREYDRMRGAYERLCTRLGAKDEDPDLNTMVDAMEAIQRDLCERIFRFTQTNTYFSLRNMCEYYDHSNECLRPE